MTTMPPLPTEEILIDQLDPDKWVTVEQPGFRPSHSWHHPETGARILLRDVPQRICLPATPPHAATPRVAPRARSASRPVRMIGVANSRKP